MSIIREFVNAIKGITYKNIKQLAIYAIIPALLFYSLSLIILRNSGFETMEVLRDSAQLSGESSFMGFLSNIGIWLWVSSAAICFFVVASKKSVLEKSHKELLILSGVLSLILAIDDFFMIHDRYVNEYICYVIYAICAGALLLRQFKMILKIEPLAFLLMGAFLMSSILTDVGQSRIPLDYSVIQLFEEGFKFIGASVWLYFNFKVGAFKTT